VPPPDPIDVRPGIGICSTACYKTRGLGRGPSALPRDLQHAVLHIPNTAKGSIDPLGPVAPASTPKSQLSSESSRLASRQRLSILVTTDEAHPEAGRPAVPAMAAAAATRRDAFRPRRKPRAGVGSMQRGFTPAVEHAPTRELAGRWPPIRHRMALGFLDSGPFVR
jgi:hypothetical protein